LLERSGLADVKDRPASLLVQHLATPDMVLYLCTGDYSRAGLPRYQPDSSGLLRQDRSPYFPAATLDVNEVIDPTFYTHRPPTSPAMKAVIAAHGGSGVVVSSHECLERYPQIRDLLSGLGRDLPDDPRALREWSVVMALTGTLNALDRGLLGDAAEVVVHGSGWYSDGDFAPVGDEGVVLVNDVEDVRKAVLG
jgi:hypothetical protein